MPQRWEVGADWTAYRKDEPMEGHEDRAEERAETVGGYMDAAKDALHRKDAAVASVYATLAVAEALLSLGQRQAK